MFLFDIYDEEISDEFGNIRKSARTLRVNFNEAFAEYAESKRKTINNDEEASILRHDLRTPLNGIIGYSEILIEDYEDETLDIIQRIESTKLNIVMIKMTI